MEETTMVWTIMKINGENIINVGISLNITETRQFSEKWYSKCKIISIYLHFHFFDNYITKHCFILQNLILLLILHFYTYIYIYLKIYAFINRLINWTIYQKIYFIFTLKILLSLFSFSECFLNFLPKWN